MSVHVIFYQQGHKMMEAVATEEAYRRYRDSQAQQRWVETIRRREKKENTCGCRSKPVRRSVRAGNDRHGSDCQPDC